MDEYLEAKYRCSVLMELSNKAEGVLNNMKFFLNTSAAIRTIKCNMEENGEKVLT
jgi:hypothetical protein